MVTMDVIIKYEGIAYIRIMKIFYSVFFLFINVIIYKYSFNFIL